MKAGDRASLVTNGAGQDKWVMGGNEMGKNSCNAVVGGSAATWLSFRGQIGKMGLNKRGALILMCMILLSGPAVGQAVEGDAVAAATTGAVASVVGANRSGQVAGRVQHIPAQVQ